MSPGAGRGNRPNQPAGAPWRPVQTTPTPEQQAAASGSGNTDASDGGPQTPARPRPPIVPPASRPSAGQPRPSVRPAPRPISPASDRDAAHTEPTSALGFATAQAAGAESVVADSSAARFAERAKAVSRLRHRRMLIALCVVLAILATGYLIWFSPVLALRADGIEITGTNKLAPTASIEQIAKKYVGSPMARLDTASMRAELLKVHGVRDARVARSWPHGVQIAITPRTAVAAIPVEGGFITVDADAVHLERLPQAPAGIPVMQIPLDTSARKVMMSVLNVLEAIPADLAKQIASVKATTVDNVVLTLSDGATVEWGSASDSALKAQVLAVLRKQPAKVYDVSAPTMPVTKN